MKATTQVPTEKKKAVAKARKTNRANKKGVKKATHRVHTKVRFYRPKTLTLKRTPKYARLAK
jgi:hypothetical protein